MISLKSWARVLWNFISRKILKSDWGFAPPEDGVGLFCRWLGVVWRDHCLFNVTALLKYNIHTKKYKSLANSFCDQETEGDQNYRIPSYSFQLLLPLKGHHCPEHSFASFRVNTVIQSVLFFRTWPLSLSMCPWGSTGLMRERQGSFCFVVSYSILGLSSVAGEHVSRSHLWDDDGASADFLCTCCGNIPRLPFRFVSRNGTKGVHRILLL